MDKGYEFDIVMMCRVRFKEEPKDAVDEWKRQLFQIKLDVYAQKVRLWLLGKLGKIGMAARIGSN